MTGFAEYIASWRNHPDAEPNVRLVVLDVAGSTPRETGATMTVGAATTTSTIGGGQLEFEAIAHARMLLSDQEANQGPWQRDVRAWPLGPGIGQCCGGTVRILFEIYNQHTAGALTHITDASINAVTVRKIANGHPIHVCSTQQHTVQLPPGVAAAVTDMLNDPAHAAPSIVTTPRSGESYFIEPLHHPRIPLFVYGAGHVGQAVVKTVSELDFDVHWVDTHQDRFPDPLPPGVTPIVAREPARITSAAPAGAFHLVMTYSHAIDLAICHAALARTVFGYLGLIGSATKRARFRNRLRDAGITTTALDQLTCPVGVGRYRNKTPAAIAISVAAQLIEQAELSQGQRLIEIRNGNSQRLFA